MELQDCHTLREIFHQPKMWKETFETIQAQRSDLEAFLKKIMFGLSKGKRNIKS